MRSKPDSRQHMKSEVLLLAMYNFPQLVRIARHANVALSPGAERTGSAPSAPRRLKKALIRVKVFFVLLLPEITAGPPRGRRYRQATRNLF